MPEVSGATASGSADWGDSLVTDQQHLRDQFVALLQKLDADAGTGDADYESTLTPNAMDTTTG